MEAGALKEWRRKHGLSQKRLAQELGVSPQAVAHWEQGLRRIPALLPLALETLERRLRNSREPNREGRTMARYEVKMTVCSTVEAGSKQEAKDKAMESLHDNPLVDEVWVTQTIEGVQDGG